MVALGADRKAADGLSPRQRCLDQLAGARIPDLDPVREAGVGRDGHHAAAAGPETGGTKVPYQVA